MEGIILVPTKDIFTNRELKIARIESHRSGI